MTDCIVHSAESNLGLVVECRYVQIDERKNTEGLLVVDLDGVISRRRCIQLRRCYGVEEILSFE